MPIRINELKSKRMWKCAGCRKWFEGKFKLYKYEKYCKECYDRIQFIKDYEMEGQGDE